MLLYNSDIGIILLSKILKAVFYDNRQCSCLICTLCTKAFDVYIMCIFLYNYFVNLVKENLFAWQSNHHFSCWDVSIVGSLCQFLLWQYM